MEPPLAGTAALVTGASSGIGAATARRLAHDGACVALVARRRDRLQALAASIENAGGTVLAVEADITDRAQADAAVQQAAGRFRRLDILVNNAGLMLLGTIAGADPQEWNRMIAINVQGLLYTTRAALPHLLQAAEQGPRRVADIVNVSSVAGRVAWNGYGVYSLTKFGVNGFTESLRQEVTQRNVRVGVVEPGGVATELGSHNKPEIRDEMIDPFYQQTEVLAPEDIADGIAYMISRPRRVRQQREMTSAVAVHRLGSASGGGPGGDLLAAWAESLSGQAARRSRGRLRFAFYGRVSTEDWQDPVTSRARQLQQAAMLVAGHGVTVVEFFDAGESRTQPWAPRPQAGALADPDRGGTRS